MLFIGGTRDGQRLYVPWNNGNPVLKIPIEEKPSIKNIMSPVENYIILEIYIKKEIWKKKQHIFSVMVKDGSDVLLCAFLDEYNKKIEEQI